jgi:hypothetical protein
MGNKSLIREEKPKGALIHSPSHTKIFVYENIGWFKRLMLKWCFGLKYESFKVKKFKIEL